MCVFSIHHAILQHWLTLRGVSVRSHSLLVFIVALKQGTAILILLECQVAAEM